MAGTSMQASPTPAIQRITNGLRVMTELNELYQELVMDHFSKPRNFREVEGANRTAEGFNPFCGDKIALYLKVEDGTISDIGFQGSGCAISRAAASLMTESVKGKSETEAEAIFEAFHDMLMRGPDGDLGSEELGDLEVLSGVARFPVRVKCASLSWHALRAALASKQEPITTE